MITSSLLLPFVALFPNQRVPLSGKVFKPLGGLLTIFCFFSSNFTAATDLLNWAETNAPLWQLFTMRGSWVGFQVFLAISQRWNFPLQKWPFSSKHQLMSVGREPGLLSTYQTRPDLLLFPPPQTCSCRCVLVTPKRNAACACVSECFFTEGAMEALDTF